MAARFQGDPSKSTKKLENWKTWKTEENVDHAKNSGIAYPTQKKLGKVGNHAKKLGNV